MRRERRLASWCLALSAAAVLATAAPGARAQTDDERAAARTAATEGLAALQQGRFQEAVDLFKRAETIIHAPPHLLYMARAQAKLGKLVSAHETYLKVSRETLAGDAPRAFVEAQESAAADLAELTPRIPSLKIDVEGAAPDDLTLVIDGAPFPSAVIGLMRPIDPGSHVVQARSKTAVSDEKSVTIAEGAKETVKLVLAPVTHAAEGPAVATAGDEKKGSGSRTAAYVAFGVGAAGLVVGTISMLQSRSARDDADALCPGGPCPASKRTEIESLDSDATGAATRAWIGYGVGVVGVGVGVALLLTSGGGGGGGGGRAAVGRARGPRPTAWIDARSGGVGLGGAF